MARIETSLAIALTAAIAGSGCAITQSDEQKTTGSTVDAGSPDAKRPNYNYADAAPPKPCDKMDILFVVDDSGSMVEEQDNLAANFPQFIDVLNVLTTSYGELLDYRVAVTTTGRDVNYTLSIPGTSISIPFSEKGANGEFQMGCSMTKRWLERGEPDLNQNFSCIAEVGTNGPGIEMPLLAVELAFEDRVADGTNDGFLRDDALLAIIILTDEDDCSRSDDGFNVLSEGCESPGPNHIDPAATVAFLDDLTGSRGRWAAAVIAGPGPGTCTSQFGEAVEASRLKGFVNQAGDNSVFTSICEGDLAPALADTLLTFDEACQDFPPID